MNNLGTKPLIPEGNDWLSTKVVPEGNDCCFHSEGVDHSYVLVARPIRSDIYNVITLCIYNPLNDHTITCRIKRFYTIYRPYTTADDSNVSLPLSKCSIHYTYDTARDQLHCFTLVLPANDCTDCMKV